MSQIREFTKGIWDENPTFRLVLGMCPPLAITTAAVNGIGMGLSTTFVLVFSNIVISLLRNVIPDKVRLPAYIVVIASFVTIVDLIMNGFFHPIHKVLGIFIPLIVVNCIILGRAEAFANKNPVLASTLDGLGMGLGFTLALVLVGSIREALGNGTIFGLHVLPAGYQPFLIFILPPGAFLVIGFMIAAQKKFFQKGGAR